MYIVCIYYSHPLPWQNFKTISPLKMYTDSQAPKSQRGVHYIRSILEGEGVILLHKGFFPKGCTPSMPPPSPGRWWKCLHPIPIYTFTLCSLDSKGDFAKQKEKSLLKMYLQIKTWQNLLIKMAIRPPTPWVFWVSIGVAWMAYFWGSLGGI